MRAIVARGSRPHPGAIAKLSPGNFPLDRTQGSSPFQVKAVDYAESTNYKKGGKVESKAYIHCSVVCKFDPVSCIMLRFSVFTGNPRVPFESKEVNCKKGETRQDLV